LALLQQFISILIPNCLNLDAPDERMGLMGAAFARLALLLEKLNIGGVDGKIG
jgi:hypothetical protein